MFPNSELASSNSKLFKGIALFTPGGDLVYCIDPEKRSRWHLQLCTALQEALQLTEPPHFLVPCYTATIDRWLDPQTQCIQTFAESSPLVLRHQALLNVLFGVDSLVWTALPCPEGVCDPPVVESYRQQFPQLWEEHDLVMRFDQAPARSLSGENSTLSWLPPDPPAEAALGYVLRLFVSGNSVATEKILKILHQILEQSLQQPYTLKVIDIQRHPEQAEANQITATPTLVKVWPHPLRRIVGDLSDTQKVLRILSGGNYLE
ncbi:MAG: circadian clock KaiB family protein [Drouetiella hepatica Uher 2000/2452]|jgi:circadian clock protein KaiB|uniref:Circadian clock KaiB family protein n=1 Tax=Drouetiella hepatica Uher 2000/2452 TaxID=904376 RepID=A0A951UM72_9CYAN|nr:circadian clock KaiB family protein [Drouetiella hepatica Uher 2000/2452]